MAIFTHQFQLLFRDCDYPKGFMIWIGLHGVMFLFLFSDFYKAKYLNAQRRRREAVKANGYSNGVHANGEVKNLGSGDTQLTNGSNKGACMVSLCSNDSKSNNRMKFIWQESQKVRRFSS